MCSCLFKILAHQIMLQQLFRMFTEVTLMYFLNRICYLFVKVLLPGSQYRIVNDVADQGVSKSIGWLNRGSCFVQEA